MLNLMRAEWIKLSRNYMLTSFLVWIYPVGVAVALGIGLLASLALGEVVQGLASGPGDWRNGPLGAWGIVTAFPVNVFGRILPLAFMAVAFAGEYEWGTWKNLLPRNRRTHLMLAKLIVPSFMVMLSLFLASLLLGLGSWASHQISGERLGPALTGDVIIAFIRDYGREAALALASLLLLSAVAAIGAILTRSILGALLVSFGFSLLDLIGIGIFMLLAFIFKTPSLINLMIFTPNYSTENIRSWLIHQAPAKGFGPALTVEPGLPLSLICLVLWLVGSAALAVWLFQRQDISS